jgi:8-oxo-dGTP pyrophosphatase MutT (NUDIX family)
MQPQFKWPSRLVDLSACILFVRRCATRAGSKHDYELLLLQRNQKLSFGGYYAFPGGKIETQDRLEKYVEKGIFPPDVGYHDFDKRAAAIRETFEECSILLTDNTAPSNAIEEYEKLANFPNLMSKYNLKPDIQSLFAFRRLGTPIGLPAP